MKKIIILSALFLFFTFQVFPCFTVVVGKKASYNGAVLFGHNEDDMGNGILRLWKFERKNYNEEFTLLNGDKEYIGRAASLLWIELKGQKVADTFLNEYGVALASDACPSKLKKGDGIIYFLRRLVAEKARTAREGVQIAGALIEKHGYPEGRTLIIVDPNEGWFLHILGGKHWLAWRVPDDAVATIPNFYTLKEVNLEDRKNFMASEDIVKLAIEKGLYDPKKDGKFDFARVFSSKFSYEHPRNINRQWRALELLSGKKWPRKSGLPPYFKPDHKIKPQDIFRVLRDHYEGTDLDLTHGYRDGSPYRMNTRPICTYTTQYSFVMELRPGIPIEIGGLIWFAPTRPDSTPYIPLYFGISKFKEEYIGPRASTTHDEIKERHFNPSPSIELKRKYFFFHAFRILSDYLNTDRNYLRRIDEVRKSINTLEKEYFALKPYVEKTALEIYRVKGDKEAKGFITSYVWGAMERARINTLCLIRKFSRSQVNKKGKGKE